MVYRMDISSLMMEASPVLCAWSCRRRCAWSFNYGSRPSSQWFGLPLIANQSNDSSCVRQVLWELNELRELRVSQESNYAPKDTWVLILLGELDVFRVFLNYRCVQSILEYTVSGEHLKCPQNALGVLRELRVPCIHNGRMKCSKNNLEYEENSENPVN